MNIATQNLENLLRLINDQRPGAWFPRVYSEKTGIALEAINYFLEELYLDGLVERGGPGPEGNGPGVVLTDKGRRVLGDATALQRLREGKALEPSDRGGQVREFLRRSNRPWITWMMIFLNFAFFGYEIYLAGKRNLTRELLGFFMQGGNNLTPILIDSGASHGALIMEGEWWRLLTACFVHIGLLHLFSNTYVLWREGFYFEQMWGWWRYLLIYLFSGLGGSLFAVAYQPRVTTAGASGALCGLLSAAGVWMVLNRRYLPRQIFQRWIGAFLVNTMLIVFLSMFPGVSGWGHGGGALVGMIVALLLNWQRFGRGVARWLGLLALLPLPYIGYLILDHQRATNIYWKELEELHFQKGRADRIDGPGYKLIKALDQVRRESVRWGLLFQGTWRRDQDNWKDRDPAEVKELVADLDSLRQEIGTLQTNLRRAQSRYRQPWNLAFLDDALQILQAEDDYLRLSREYLTERTNLTEADRENLKTLQKQAEEALQACKGLEQKRLEEQKGP
jgi:rhomboid protease GluP